MTYHGKYSPKNPKKYKGNPSNIIYRSLWERKFMVYCDLNVKIIEWSSEETVIPYRSPLDGRFHRYFPDFYIKVLQENGNVQSYLVEVKPKKQVNPPKAQKRVTKRYLSEVHEYAKNQAKWKAATEYCNDRRWKFLVLTEDELKV